MSKILILGAGPAGLALANRLKQNRNESFLVLEAENEAGGLCRSRLVDGAPLDIGGGHFLDVRRPKVNNFLFEYMPKEEWNLFERDSKIFIHNQYIGHPFEANIWQLNIDEQVEYLKDIAKAGSNNDTEEPKDFVDWIYWKLGCKIANDYMIPYNQKMFGNELNQLGTYWMEKLPNVSFDDTLRSCLTKKAFGQQPGHAQFYYPKRYGYGELWLRMAEELGDKIVYNAKVCEININKREVKTENGEVFNADYVITTIPWIAFVKIYGMPQKLISGIRKLKFSSIQIQYIPENINTQAHWIYYPNLDVTYHRILVRSNFCNGSRGYWTETNISRTNAKDYERDYIYKCKYAYPLNTIGKPEFMNELLAWNSNHGVIGLGRWGEHQHYNSDLTVERALKLADDLSTI